MAPRQTAVALSAAHRDGEVVVVQVHLPDGDRPRDDALLVLRRTGEEVAAPVTVRETQRGWLVAARFPSGAQLRPGPRPTSWPVSLRQGGATRRLTAFLLVPSDGPVALLWGEPHAAPAAAPSRARAAGAAGGALADRALALLPPERALQARSALRRVGRRVLG